MTVTLLDVVQRVSRHVGLDPTITSFSNNDETNDIVQFVNEAYEELIMALPENCPYLNDSGTITTVASTRLYALETGAFSYNLYSWSLQDETSNDKPLQLVTLDYIATIDDRYDEVEGIPAYMYAEGSNQLGIYPVPNGVYTIKYQYAKDLQTRLTTTTDTFIFPDRWIRFVEKRAQEKYERLKAFSEPDYTLMESETLLTNILVEAWEMNPTYIFSEDF